MGVQAFESASHKGLGHPCKGPRPLCILIPGFLRNFLAQGGVLRSGLGSSLGRLMVTAARGTQVHRADPRAIGLYPWQRQSDHADP